MDIGATPVSLVLAPGTASGYKRVKKINGRTFQAQRTVGGTQQHVWTSDDPRECAYVLARLELEPLSEEQIKSACKEAAKERRETRVHKRVHDELTRRIDRLHEAWIERPRRAVEAAKRARTEAESRRVREADEWYASLW